MLRLSCDNTIHVIILSKIPGIIPIIVAGHLPRYFVPIISYRLCKSESLCSQLIRTRGKGNYTPVRIFYMFCNYIQQTVMCIGAIECRARTKHHFSSINIFTDKWGRVTISNKKGWLHIIRSINQGHKSPVKC